MKKRELLTFTNAVLFIIGAVFLTFNIATGRGIMFYLGLTLALIAFAVWVFSLIVEKTNAKADPQQNQPDKR
jgi:hypothetical protein